MAIRNTVESDGIEGKDAVGLYLNEIARTPLLTAQEEVVLAKQIEAGILAKEILSGAAPNTTDADTEELEIIAAEGDAAKQRFISANLRLVVSVAKRYGRGAMPLLDMVQEGNAGLIRAVEKFDYSKGFKFSTYATWWVRQAITRGIAQQARIVRLPVHVAEQINQVSAARHSLSRLLGREPDSAEIAAELGIEVSRVLDLESIAREHLSLDAPLDTDSETSLGDLMAGAQLPGPDDFVISADMANRVEALLANLDDRSADILKRRYGLMDGHQAKLSEIAEHWGITPERVRQIERAAMSALRSPSLAA